MTTPSTSKITVHVKTMAGEMIPLSIDPSIGLRAIEIALRTENPKIYSTPFRVFPLEEYDTHTPFYDGMYFGVYLFPPPTLEDIQSYDQLDCFTFQLNDQTVYVYTLLTVTGQLLFRFSTQFIPLDDAYLTSPYDQELRIGYYNSLFEAAVKRGMILHPRHSEAILSQIREFVTTHRYPDVHITQLSYEPVECPCGAVVQRRSLAMHQKSQKHIDQLK